MHPVAFKIGEFTIYYYGLMMVVAYLVVIALMWFTRKYEGFDMNLALDCTIYSIIGGVIGARLVYVVLNLGQYLKSPLHIINVREGGLSWHGALLGAFVGLVILSRTKGASLGKLTDFTAVHGTIALAIGRIGCFLNGCCYGKVCELPWAVEFKGAGLHGTRHPTQLYECFLMLILFAILLWWWRRKRFDGELTMAMFAGYGVIRFIVEFFRENTPDQYLWGTSLSLAQYFSLLLIVVFTAAILIKGKRTNSTPNSP